MSTEYKTGRLGTCNYPQVEFAQLADNTFHLQVRGIPINPIGSREDWVFVLRRMSQRRACRRSQVGVIWSAALSVYIFRNPLYQSTAHDGFMLFECDVPTFVETLKSVL